MDDDNADNEDLGAAVEAATLAAFGVRPQRLDPIPAGLGSRRFIRASFGPATSGASQNARPVPSTVIARVEREEDPRLRPAGIPPEPPLEPLRSVLEDSGLPVPARYATHENVTLLEDVGDTSLEAAAQAGLPMARVAEFYAHACSLVPLLQRVPSRDDVPAFARSLDETLFQYKAEQFVSWTLPWARGSADVPPSLAAAVRDAFGWIASVCAQAPMRLAHRDYKAANLHVTTGLDAAAAHSAATRPLVMIDIQGAFLAPPEYDLVCLLRDSHVALPEPLVEDLLAETRSQLPDAPDPDSFQRRFTLLTLTRNGKDLSRYLYAAHERGDERYLELVPRAVATLKAAAQHAENWNPVLSRLADIIATLPDSP
jgi:aminoglycoside/choline kinase family phosphotransferase